MHASFLSQDLGSRLHTYSIHAWYTHQHPKEFYHAILGEKSGIVIPSYSRDLASCRPIPDLVDVFISARMLDKGIESRSWISASQHVQKQLHEIFMLPRIPQWKRRMPMPLHDHLLDFKEAPIFMIKAGFNGYQ